MEQMMIYWKSIIPQYVSGVFTPIIRRAELGATAYDFLSCKMKCCVMAHTTQSAITQHFHLQDRKTLAVAHSLLS